MKYTNHIDTFYTIFIIMLGLLGIIVSDIFFILGFWYVSLIVVLIFGFIYYMFFTSGGELSEDKLIIKVGFYKKNINYLDIKEVKVTKNALASFATSLKRIGIRTGDKVKAINYIYISPKDSDKFLSELTEKLNKDIIINK